MFYDKYGTRVLKNDFGYSASIDWPNLDDEVYDNSLKGKRFIVAILESHSYYESARGGGSTSASFKYLDLWYVDDKSKLSDFLLELSEEKKEYIVFPATPKLTPRFKVDVQLS